MTYNEKRRAYFIPYLEKIKSFGYKVRICNSEYYHYAFIIDKHNVVGYCEIGDFDWFNMSTCHRPTRECGTGFSVARGVSLADLTPSLVERCFCIVPQRFSSTYNALVKKVVIDDGSKESLWILNNSVEF